MTAAKNKPEAREYNYPNAKNAREARRDHEYRYPHHKVTRTRSVSPGNPGSYGVIVTARDATPAERGY